MFAVRYGKKVMSSERGTAKELAISVAKIGAVGAVVVAGALYVVDEVTGLIPDLPSIPGLTQAGEWTLDALGGAGLPVPHDITVGADGKIDDFEPVTDETPLYTRTVDMDSIEIGDGVVIKGKYKIKTSLVGDLMLGRDGDAGDPGTEYYVFMHGNNDTPDNPADDTLEPFSPNDPSVQFIDTIGRVEVLQTAKLYEECITRLDASSHPGGDRSLSGCEIREVNPAVKQVPASVVENARWAFLSDQRCADSALHTFTNTAGYGLTSPIGVNESGIMGDKTVTMQHVADVALAGRFAPLLQTTPDNVHLVVRPQTETVTYLGDKTVDFSKALPEYWETAKELDLVSVEKSSDGIYKAPAVVQSWCAKGSIRDLQTYVSRVGGEMATPEFSARYLERGLTYAAPDAVVPIMNPVLPPLSTTRNSTSEREQTETTDNPIVTTTIG